MKDIAKRLNVSITTVGRAFSDATDISPDTRDKIFEVAKDIGYRPNLNARALVQQKTSVIGMILCNVSNPMMEGVIKGVEDFISAKGYHLNLAISHREARRELEIVNNMICRGVDGVIIHPYCPEGRSEAVENLLETRIPTVVLGAYDYSSVSQVGMDFFTAGYEITTHLMDLGHKRIAFVNEIPNDPRYKAYLKAHEDRQLDIDNDIFFSLPLNAKNGVDICREILSKKATAVFAISDALAATILEGFKFLGVKVPDDIALAGCGNDRFSSVMGPTLTTYGFPYSNLPKHLAEFVLNGIETSANTIKTAILIGKLIPRESTLGLGTPITLSDQTKPFF
jgi:DNA-binding LacI/PurR family transcriptional regulator